MTKVLLASVVAMLAVASPLAARAEAPGYVDTIRVRSVATEPKRLDAGFDSDRAARRQKENEAIAHANDLKAKGAKQADQNAAWADAWRLQQDNSESIAKNAADVDSKFLGRLGAVLARLRSAKHVSVTAGAGVVLVPGVDLTEEAIRIWDESDAKGMADENARLKAQVAALKAKPSDAAAAPAGPPAQAPQGPARPPR